MNKPNGYDEARVSGEYTPVDLGGHYCMVKQVTETQSSSGKDMVVVLFDFCSPDDQKDYFGNICDEDIRDQKKWPFAGTRYIMVHDFQDQNKTSRQFKTFCSCIEKSNNYAITWGGKNWGAQFKGKKIGVVFGEEEQEYNGRTFMRRIPKYFVSWDTVKDAEVPDPKYLTKTATATTGSNDFVNVPEGSEDEIPF